MMVAFQQALHIRSYMNFDLSDIVDSVSRDELPQQDAKSLEEFVLQDKAKVKLVVVRENLIYHYFVFPVNASTIASLEVRLYMRLTLNRLSMYGSQTEIISVSTVPEENLVQNIELINS